MYLFNQKCEYIINNLFYVGHILKPTAQIVIFSCDLLRFIEESFHMIIYWDFIANSCVLAAVCGILMLTMWFCHSCNQTSMKLQSNHKEPQGTARTTMTAVHVVLAEFVALFAECLRNTSASIAEYCRLTQQLQKLSTSSKPSRWCENTVIYLLLT